MAQEQNKTKLWGVKELNKTKGVNGNSWMRTIWSERPALNCGFIARNAKWEGKWKGKQTELFFVQFSNKQNVRHRLKSW